MASFRSPSGSQQSRLAARAAPAAATSQPQKAVRQFVDDDEEEELDWWDMSLQDLALDLRELLITDANVFVMGPDTESYRDSAKELARMLNYSYYDWEFLDLYNATDFMDRLQNVVLVPPLVSVQRWSHKVMLSGLVVWLDPDGYKHLTAFERDRIRKLKFPKKKVFGPQRPWKKDGFIVSSEEPPADPLDMWREADVHVDLTIKQEEPVLKNMFVSCIKTILDNPPKWRGWMKQAKIRGSVPWDFQTSLEVGRAHRSFGISIKLQKLLTA